MSDDAHPFDFSWIGRLHGFEVIEAGPNGCVVQWKPGDKREYIVQIGTIGTPASKVLGLDDGLSFTWLLTVYVPMSIYGTVSSMPLPSTSHDKPDQSGAIPPQLFDKWLKLPDYTAGVINIIAHAILPNYTTKSARIGIQSINRLANLKAPGFVDPLGPFEITATH